jgi:hypothetical protein
MSGGGIGRSMRDPGGGRLRAGSFVTAAVLLAGMFVASGCVANPPPRIGTATAGNGMATVTWQPPLAAPFPITGYVVTPWVGQTAGTAVRFNSTATTQTVIGLSNGTVYTFTVVAIDALGNDSASSATSNAVTPSAALPGFSFANSISANHRFLLDQNGSPYLIVGDSPHALLGNVSQSDTDKYFADRQAHHVNAAWVDLLCTTYTGCSSVNTYDGVAPFTTPYDLSTPNPAYFQRVDAMLNLAAKHGITVFLDPAETGGWLGTLTANGTAKDRAYGQFLGSRYKSFPNIVWISGNDFQTWSTPSDDAAVLAVAQGIRAAGDTHLQTVELNYFVSLSSDDANWSTVSDLEAAYTYYPTYNEVLRGYYATPTKPTFMVEAHYDGESVGPGGFGTPIVLRRQEYWTMTSGAAGQLYGTAYWGFASGWQSGIDTVGANELTIMEDFFASQPWSDLIPDQGHALITAGYGTYDSLGATATNDYVTGAITPTGNTAVIYLPSTRTITVNMSKLSGTITAKWFDPTTGQYIIIGTFPNTGSHQFRPSDDHGDGTSDWVLLLQS